jgi:glycosyltransferase involved in cell wall biosynthesis
MRILILAKDFPPLNVIAAKRPSSWIKHWTALGSTVTLITSTMSDFPQNDESDIIRVKPAALGNTGNLSILYRKIRSVFEIWLPFLLPLTSRYSSIYFKASEILKREKFDCIIASGEPFILFAFASKLSKQSGVPWCADYRDIWSKNPILLNSRKLSSKLKTYYFSKVERYWLKSARLITTASPTYTKVIQKLLNKKDDVYTIMNGHDIDFEIKQPNLNNDFTLVYAGRLYPFQPLEAFMSALQEFSEQAQIYDKIKIKFLGLQEWPDQLKRAQNASGFLRPDLEFLPSMDYEKYIDLLSQSHCMILLSEKNMEWLNAKVFDYLAMKGAICHFYSKDGILEHLLKDEKGCYSANNTDELIKILHSIYNQYKAKQINFSRDSIIKHSRKLRAEEMLKIIELNV